MIRSQKLKFRELNGVDMAGLLLEWHYTLHSKRHGKLFSMNLLKRSVQHAATPE
jgi:hypothetical protein